MITSQGKRRWAAAAVGLALALTPGARADVNRVLLMGDSIMVAGARSMEREIRRLAPAVRVHTFTSLGSGLARLDAFDWHAKFREMVEAHQPDTAVVMIGTNDSQPMMGRGETIRPGSPEWEAEYARRVGEAMDILITGGVNRIFWLELPDMREDRLQEETNLINRLGEREAKKRPQVTFHPTRPTLSLTPGTYSAWVRQPNGMPIEVRDRDGVHLNRPGADRLAAAVIPVVLGQAPRSGR